MAGKKEEEKKKPQHLDDFLKGLETEHSTSLDEAFKARDDFVKEENQNHLYVNVFVPGQDALYNTLVSELDKAFEKKDDKKIEKQEERDKVKKAVGKALKKYFEKVQPSISKTIDDMKMDDDEQYEFLTSMYDQHTGGGTQFGQQHGIKSIKASIDNLLEKKKTIGHIKKDIYDSKVKQLGGAMALLGEKYINHHFGRYHHTTIAAYLKPKLEKAGVEIKDKLEYATLSTGKLLDLRDKMIEKKLEEHEYITKKKEEDKK
ncbi:hypothetical protein HZC30_05375 [Candidatus Woesearchaeota archaeon]|nr:hypothetical protein [Candidatus Woesearchaeota archaeon]